MKHPILTLKAALKAGLTQSISKPVPVQQAHDLVSMLADMHAALVPAALVLVKGTPQTGEVCVHRQPVKKRLRPSWDFADDGTGPKPVFTKKRGFATGRL